MLRITFQFEGTVRSPGITVRGNHSRPASEEEAPMFRKAFSFGGLLLLPVAAVLVTAGSGQAQHHGGGGHGGGGHGGGGHGGGGHGGGVHGGGFHGGGFHGAGFNRGGGFHCGAFSHHGCRTDS